MRRSQEKRRGLMQVDVDPSATTRTHLSQDKRVSVHVNVTKARRLGLARWRIAYLIWDQVNSAWHNDEIDHPDPFSPSFDA